MCNQILLNVNRETTLLFLNKRFAKNILQKIVKNTFRVKHCISLYDIKLFITATESGQFQCGAYYIMVLVLI